MNPKQALELAAANYLAGVATPIASIPSTNIYKGIENTIAINDEESNTQPQTKVLPCIRLVAEGTHSEAVFKTKIYRGILSVTVEADAHNKTAAQFNTMCDEVFKKFDIVELAVNMSARTANFYVLFARIIENGHAINNGDNWENRIAIDIVYAQADL